jgi:hypothetical protein
MNFLELQRLGTEDDYLIYKDEAYISPDGSVIVYPDDPYDMLLEIFDYDEDAFLMEESKYNKGIYIVVDINNGDIMELTLNEIKRMYRNR